MRSFESDYRCGTHPQVLAAVVEACEAEADGSYGDDGVTAEVSEGLRKVFGPFARPFFVPNGTAANMLALSVLLPRSFDAVICTENAHINNHEAGAISRLGYTVMSVSGHSGRIISPGPLITPGVRKLVDGGNDDVHMVRTAALSLANATEMGTMYDLTGMKEVWSYCYANGLALHIDGARLPYAAAAWKCKDLRRLVDPSIHGMSALPRTVLTLGATKIGGLFGDAVIVFEENETDDLEEIAARLQKQHGHLCARTHAIAAQFSALYLSDLWFDNATNANDMAQRLASRVKEGVGWDVAYPVKSNAVMLRVPLPDSIYRIQQVTDAIIWDKDEGVVRLMCSWDTTEDDVDEMVDLIRREVVDL